MSLRNSNSGRSYPPRAGSTGASTRAYPSRPQTSESQRNGSAPDAGDDTRNGSVRDQRGSASADSIQQRSSTFVQQPRDRSTPAAALSPQLTDQQINRVTYKNATIKALIDPTLPVVDVIRQLCANAHLGVQEPPALFALRDEENEELIDDATLAKKIRAGRNLRLCSSPTIEAVEMVDKLSTREERTLKMATYTLQRLIREPPFLEEFLRRGGADELIGITMSLDSGNTLAYALACMQNLMESSDDGWDDLEGSFIAKVVHILATQDRINVCRPATAILKKLVLSGPDSASLPRESVARGEGEDEEGGPPGAARGQAVFQYGFEVVYNEIRREPAFLSTLTQRLGSADTTLCLYSLSLINSLMRHASPSLFETFTAELDKLNVSKAVTRLMDSTRGEELSSSILEYQNNVIRVLHKRLNTAVSPTKQRHASALSHMWLQAQVTETVSSDDTDPDGNRSLPAVPGSAGNRFKWRRLGFETENISKEFTRTGWLGLECCESFVNGDPEAYAKIILEQINRPANRRCPWGLASLEVVEILSDHYDVDSGYTSSTEFMPYILSFTRVHSLSLRFFLRMWSESGAARSDFARVSALVRSQVKEALRSEASKTWFEVERDFIESDYRLVRDRQMRELEVGDDFASKASVRNLRGRLYRESYEFVRQQRIQCLLEGAWFKSPPQTTRSSEPLSSGRVSRAGTAGGSTSPYGLVIARPWRFYRLSPNKKVLHYCEALEIGPIRSGLDDLPERIDLGLVSEVSVQQPTGQSAESSLAFSLLRAPDVSLADFVALNASQYSEWVDGLGMLRGEGGVVSTKETAEFIQALTDIAVKVKLLDLTGERIEIPQSLPLAPLPVTTSFFFADL
ncbi:Regulator of Rac1, required for phagocytosis and cell migration [Ceraceosorus bombacis]|uniref:Regulator of Rac1, required for phagocytosis and cell migration n=1 Tax=Ceraceosorus bombacis TaxID=401625 RepID=A0A0P1B7H7_9BASI|nr:Regulator of Rac1, required for phagocytosis and cell migration [Ceraceosorus bombacis]